MQESPLDFITIVYEKTVEYLTDEERLHFMSKSRVKMGPAGSYAAISAALVATGALVMSVGIGAGYYPVALALKLNGTDTTLELDQGAAASGSSRRLAWEEHGLALVDGFSDDCHQYDNMGMPSHRYPGKWLTEASQMLLGECTGSIAGPEAALFRKLQVGADANTTGTNTTGTRNIANPKITAESAAALESIISYRFLSILIYLAWVPLVIMAALAQVAPCCRCKLWWLGCSNTVTPVKFPNIPEAPKADFPYVAVALHAKHMETFDTFTGYTALRYGDDRIRLTSIKDAPTAAQEALPAPVPADSGADADPYDYEDRGRNAGDGDDGEEKAAAISKELSVSTPTGKVSRKHTLQGLFPESSSVEKADKQTKDENKS